MLCPVLKNANCSILCEKSHKWGNKFKKSKKCSQIDGLSFPFQKVLLASKEKEFSCILSNINHHLKCSGKGNSQK